MTKWYFWFFSNLDKEKPIFIDVFSNMHESSDKNDPLSNMKWTQQTDNDSLGNLPEKSRAKYLSACDVFEKWRVSNGARTYSETVLLAYFEELAATKKPTTLWSVYSMLKAVIKAKHDVDIQKYRKLMAFVKMRNVGFEPKRSKMFTAPEIEKFLNEAPDDRFLDLKVVLIMGLCGACGSLELLNLKINNIERHADKFIVTILSRKNATDRCFVIRGEYVNFIEKYAALRPPHSKTDRFLLRYVNGTCTLQQMGKNKVNRIPEKIAKYLNLREPELYTGHCLRRTSAMLQTNLGTDLSLRLKHSASMVNTRRSTEQRD